MKSTEIVWFYYVIQVYNKPGGDSIEFLKWDKLTMELRKKYDWYFKYRAALLQVKYPKYEVEQRWGTYPKFSDEELKQIERKNKIAGYKRMITKITNAINKTRAEWNDIFPLEDHPSYIKAVNKLKDYECKLKNIDN